MQGEMYYDAELLDDLLNEAPVVRPGVVLTAKLVAIWTDKSVKTISDYRRGKLTIPTQFWRQLFRHHRDLRIANLILGESPCEVTFLDDLPDLTNGGAVLDQAIASVGDFHKRHSYLAEILRDGRIDEADTDAIKSYNAAYMQGRVHEAAIRHAVNSAFIANKRETAS